MGGGGRRLFLFAARAAAVFGSATRPSVKPGAVPLCLGKPLRVRMAPFGQVAQVHSAHMSAQQLYVLIARVSSLAATLATNNATAIVVRRELFARMPETTRARGPALPGPSWGFTGSSIVGAAARALPDWWPGKSVTRRDTIFPLLFPAFSPLLVF